MHRDPNRTTHNTHYWFDITDTTNWFVDRKNKVEHLTGIQRVVASLLASNSALRRDNVHIVLSHDTERGYVEIDKSVFRDLTDLTENNEEDINTYLKAVMDLLILREAKPKKYKKPKNTVKNFFKLYYKKANLYFHRKNKLLTTITELEAKLNMTPKKPGARDVVVMIGSPWGWDFWKTQVAHVDQKNLVPMIYDILPITHANFFIAPKGFHEYVDYMVQHCNHILTISSYCSQEIMSYSKQAFGMEPSVLPVRLGDEVPLPYKSNADDVGQDGKNGTEKNGTEKNAHIQNLLQEGTPFVLTVCTLEVRKNHRTIVDVWRRLVNELGSQNVPTLVFVGRIGHRARQVLDDLEKDNFVGGKVLHLMGVSDRELHDLYSSCLFTLYPSFVEGWGLPVAESLARGKVCLASNGGALPEAGKGYADFFDPNDRHALYELVKTYVTDPKTRLAREEEIKKREVFTWEKSFDSLYEALSIWYDDVHKNETIKPNYKKKIAIET